MQDTSLHCEESLGFSHVSVPVVNPFTSYVERVRALVNIAGFKEECQGFLTYYRCAAQFTPCNETSMKIYSLCENSCEIIVRVANKCLEFAAMDQNLKKYISEFNCSNPLTYTSPLTMDFYQKPPDEMCNKMLNIFGRYTHFVRMQTFKAKCLLYGNVPAKTHIVHASMHIENKLMLYYFYRFHSALNMHKYTLYYIVFFTSIVFQDGSCTDIITDLLFIFIYWSCFLSHFQNGGVCFSLNQGAYKAYY